MTCSSRLISAHLDDFIVVAKLTLDIALALSELPRLADGARGRGDARDLTGGTIEALRFLAVGVLSSSAREAGRRPSHRIVETFITEIALLDAEAASGSVLPLRAIKAIVGDLVVVFAGQTLQRANQVTGKQTPEIRNFARNGTVS